jgi:FkbM family methyltransferase
MYKIFLIVVLVLLLLLLLLFIIYKKYESQTDQLLMRNLSIYDYQNDINCMKTNISDSECKKCIKLKTLPPKSRLSLIHNKMKFVGGNITKEYPEQYLTVEYLSSDAKVLEIGSNIGRNTLTIASLLDDPTQFVTLECNPTICKILEKNKQLNNFGFHIEPSALSERRLFLKGDNTYTEETKPFGSIEINTIKWDDLISKYGINFDTIVADCEGALYYILKDRKDILNNIKLIIMENDYYIIDHKKYVDSVLLKHRFRLIKLVPGGWGPCFNYFYEVWSK